MRDAILKKDEISYLNCALSNQDYNSGPYNHNTGVKIKDILI